MAALLVSVAIPFCAQSQTTIYSQNFNSASPWGGMSTNDLAGVGPDHIWIEGSLTPRGNQTGGTGDYAVADSDNLCDSDIWDSELRTPALDFTPYINVQLKFRSRFRSVYNDDTESAFVEVSTDGGTTWTAEYSTQTSQPNGGVLVTVDLSDYNTTPNVRVRWRYEEGITCAWYWQIDDIAITGDMATACSGTPVGGTAVSSQTQVCTGGSVNLSLSGATVGTGLTYQWQSSTDGGFTWANIGGATGATTSQVVTDSIMFRNIITCSGQSDTSLAVQVTENFMLCYCQPTHIGIFGANDCGVDFTANVTFGSINNSSDCGGTVPYNYSDYTALSTTVVVGNTYPISVTTDGDEEGVGVWIDFNHSGTFDAAELVLNGYTGNVPETYTGLVTIPPTALPGATRMRVRNRYSSNVSGTDACANFEYGEVEEYTIVVIPPVDDEAGVLTITKPEIAACDLGDKIWVNLQNLGTNPLTSATFTVKVNGLDIGATPWTGSVPPSSTMEVQIPVTYALSDGDSIWVQVSLPNGQVEDPIFAFNNTYSRKVYAGLTGNKTVYGGGADYADINAAKADLELRGVCDTVYFKIAANTYTTQHTFLPYPGAGAGRLAVFESATGNAADVVFARNGTGANDNYIFKFDGADRYMFRKLTTVNQGSTYGTSIDIRNGSDDLIFENNVFIGDTVSANEVGDFDRVIIASVQGTDDQRTTLRNNQIIGGTRAIILAGEGGSYELGHVLEGNQIINNTSMGLLIGNVSFPVIINNTFKSRTNVTDDAYGIIMNVGINGARIDGNKFEQSRFGNSLYFINAKSGVNRVLVSNNFIYSGDTTNTESNGIYVEDPNSSGFSILNNSISIRTGNSGGGAINLTDGSDMRILNNNIGSFGTAPALRVAQAFSVSVSDYNNLFGTNLSSYVGTLSTTLAAAQAASSQEAHSVSVNPGFNGTDLHTCATALNAAGVSTPEVWSDIDGDNRSNTPDIGADEFLGDAGDLLAEDAFLKCPAASVTIGNAPMNGVTYSWTPSGATSQISTTTAGTYIITATSVCGTFKDTATVANKPLPTAAFTSTTVGLAASFTNTSTNGTSYSWTFGDGQTSTEFSPSHIYEQAGTYTVSLTVTNECGSVTFGPQPVNVINAGIDEQATVNVNLFPNPTDGQFTITLNGATDAVTVSVVDVTGKTVMVKNVAAGVNQIGLDATSLSSGVYSVKISDGNFTRVLRVVRK